MSVLRRLTRWLRGWPEGSWRDQIMSLAPEHPMDLPAVQPLKAHKAKKAKQRDQPIQIKRRA